MKSTLVNMVLSLGRHHDSGRRRACRSLHRHQAAHRRSKGRKAESRDRRVLPEISFNNNPAEEAAEVTVDGETVTVFPARQDGELVGLAVESHDTNGFSGLITVMYGFNPSGDITGYAVMQHAETPASDRRWESGSATPPTASSASMPPLRTSRSAKTVAMSMPSPQPPSRHAHSCARSLCRQSLKTIR